MNKISNGVKHIIHPKHHKPISVSVAAAAGFFGLQALGYILQKNQLGIFWHVAAYVYLFLVFWTIFAYDTHRRHMLAAVPIVWSQLSNYLILPSVAYWAAAGLLFLNPFHNAIQQLWIALGTIALGASIYYLKSVFHGHKDARPGLRHAIFLVKIAASYMAFAAALGVGLYFGFGGLWTGLAILLICQLLMRQALFQHHDMGHDTLKFVLCIGLALGVGGYFVYYFWNVNFYSGALALAALYNTAWGYVHHKYIDRNLTRRIVYEYLAVLFVTLVIVFSTTNFGERLIK